MKALGPLIAAALVAGSATASAAASGHASSAGSNGGAAYGEPAVQQKPAGGTRRPSSVAARPLLESFSVAPSVLTPGQAPTVRFQVKGRAPAVRLRLVVSWPGTTAPERRIDLGRRAANAPQSVELTALADPALPEGQMSVRIAGRDSAGRLLRPAARLTRVALVQVQAHVFPLRGVFSYGTDDGRFGAGRPGHTHQGQDLIADAGTPVVAPRSGTIAYVEYQAGGAGWYVVLDGDGESFDYAFMHLKEGSIPVVKGERVVQGQRIGGVGATGAAEGNHLHFEIWQGPWYAGGQAVDPLPYLQQWQQWSPVRAGSP